MSHPNKSILKKANAAVRAGDNEGFLAWCADDIVWSTVGGETLHGNQAVRDWMAREYTAPPAFTVEQLVAEGDTVVARQNHGRGRRWQAGPARLQRCLALP
ncbi:nuclear transport factor 2 family protein [Telluria aromaticivorans]|uniref:nuclear transport factor 2 family protein n=1 Tax=Telluria aromaticivorans TaxID=2725995 RepID=UPI001E5FCDFF|nr:nuclear transport factor 2 family protein [Telluria aromaticivorans]